MLIPSKSYVITCVTKGNKLKKYIVEEANKVEALAKFSYENDSELCHGPFDGGMKIRSVKLFKGE